MRKQIRLYVNKRYHRIVNWIVT